MTEPAEPPRESPWKGADLVLPMLLLIPAADVTALDGSMAAELEVPGAALVRMSPWIMLGMAIVCPYLFFHTRWARFRRSLTMGLVFLCLMSPSLLVAATCSSIRLSRMLSSDEVEDLHRRFPFPTFLYSASGEGDCLVIRRSVDAPALRGYLDGLGVLRTTR